MGIADQSCALSTERSEHLNAGGGPALEGLWVLRAKPCRSKFLVRLRSQEMGRASIGVSLLSGAEWLEKKYKLNNKIKAVSEWETLHRFYCILLQSKIRKEQSDFAAVEFWCRGAAQFLLCRNTTSRFGGAKPLHGLCVVSQIVVNNKIAKVVSLSQKFVKSGQINGILSIAKIKNKCYNQLCITIFRKAGG